MGRRFTVVLLHVAVAVAAIAFPRLARGADDCAVRVALEGIKDAELERRLMAVVRREGGCHSPWVLRVAAAPKGQYMVALWTGSDLETRWATGLGEAETVAALLLRVAVEHRDAERPVAPPTDVASPPGSPAGSTSGAAAGAAGAGDDHPAADDALRFHAGILAGFAYAARAGGGPAVGGELTYGGPHFALGIAPRFERASSGAGARSAVVLPLVGLAGFPATPALWLGAQGELGASVERASGAAAGTTAQTQTQLGASGLDVGLSARLALALGGGWDVVLLAGARTSLAAATAEQQTTTSQTAKGNNGKGQGNGPTQTTVVTTQDPAAVDAASHLGGAAVVVTLGVGKRF